jgi:Spy/CpxP family protein refolding chaperone
MNFNRKIIVLAMTLLMPVSITAYAHGGSGMGMMMDDDYSGHMMQRRGMNGMGMMGGHRGMGMMGGHRGMGMMGGMNGMGMMGMGPMMMLPDMTDKQRNAMRDIMRDMHDKNWDRMGEMMELRNQMQDIMQADKPDPTAAGRIYDKMAKLRGQMFQERLQARNKMMDQLTDEQRKKLQEYREQYRGMGGPGMMGHGMMME